MIIVCPECSTKFNVADERIPDDGIKFRCARCKHVFFTEKPPVQEILSITTEEETIQETPTIASDYNTEVPEESEFNYDKFRELDSEIATDESFSFENKMEPEDDFLFTNEAVETIEGVVTTEEKQREITTFTTAPPEVPAENIKKKAGPDAEPILQPQPVVEKKSGPIAIIIRILLLLILSILIICGVFIYVNGIDKFNQTIQQVLGQQSNQPVQTGQITLGDLEGRFIQNEQDGELFLIRGKATNAFNEPRASIQVKGVIFDPNGKPLLQKTVFCGNALDEKELRTISFPEMEKIMGNQFGKNLSNMKIAPGKSISFDIIFKKIPKNLSEFSVKVTSSKPVTK